MANPVFILLNGPAGSGKDTAGEMLKYHLRNKEDIVFQLEKFAQPIKDAMRVMCPVVFKVDSFDDYETSKEAKDRPREDFFGKSSRDLQIAFSEGYIKPLFGEDIFGKLMLRRINENGQYRDDIKHIIAVTDSGFVPEAEVLVNHYGADRILLINIERPGYGFSGDSRDYIDLDKHGVTRVTLNNDADERVFEERLIKIVSDFIEHKFN